MMPDYVFYPVYFCLVLMMLILAYFVLFVPRKRVNLRALMRQKTNVIRKERKKKKKTIKKVITIMPNGEIKEDE